MYCATTHNVDFTTFMPNYNWTLFLPNATSIVNYEYTVPEDIQLGFINVYIDSSASIWIISLNGAALQYTTANARSCVSVLVKAGDKLKIVRDTGSATAWHTGYIRKIV